MPEPNIKEFPVFVYGNLENYNDVISRARCRIFYKGLNRNGSFITDEFADKLLATIPYAPVKGIYDQFEEDYTDHGNSRSLGRIYGIVPENPNLTWEDHLDEDGVMRTYACVDVLLFTALYKEAGEIVGKSQSMELYDKSIEGDWQQLESGETCFVFTNACFLGLQALGDNTEPCFEGSAFFSLYSSLKQAITYIENYSNSQKEHGGNEMPTINFRLSDSQKQDALWSLLNPCYTEEGGWIVDYAICDIFEDYALAFNYADGTYERISYTRDDANDAIALGEKTKCYVIDVSESEYNALQTLRMMNGTYAKTEEILNENVATIASLTEEKENFELKINECNDTIATLNTENENYQATISNLNDQIAQFTADIDSLKNENQELDTFKKAVELDRKHGIISSYSELLSDEVLEIYSDEKISTMSEKELDMELAYALKNSNPNVFTKNAPTPLVLKDQPKVGIEAILEKYKN